MTKPLDQRALEKAEDLKSELKKLSDDIYENPELGYEEFFSAGAHRDLLEKHGFQVEMPYMNMDTAFKATFDTGKPGPTMLIWRSTTPFRGSATVADIIY